MHLRLKTTPNIHMKSSSIIQIILALALSTLYALLLPNSALATDLNGAWLISPKDHDFFIETGVVTAEYPLLVVDTANSLFRIYRFGTTCSSDSYILTQTHETKKPCINTINISNIDNLTGLAILVASGKLQNNDGNIIFIPEDPDHTKNIIFSPNTPTLNPEKRIKHLITYTEIINSVFYTIKSKDDLTLKSANGGKEIVFERVNLNSLINIGSTLNSIGLSYGQYFRCAMKNLANQELFTLTRSTQSTLNEIESLSYLLFTTYSEEKFNLLQNYKQINSDLSLDLHNKFGFIQNKFGAFAGCPDRDRNF